MAPERHVCAAIWPAFEALQAHCEGELIGRIEDADALIVYHYLSLSRYNIERLQSSVS